MQRNKIRSLSVAKGLLAGVDVGGTKVLIVDNATAKPRRYSTKDYVSMEAILEDYFLSIGKRPESIALAMAGPRDDETGEVTMTNVDWPTFKPLEVAKRYPGTTFETVNDMIGATAGIITEIGTNLTQIKPGSPTTTGTKLVLTISTGVGVAAAVWDRHTKRHVFVAGEGGHISVQPKNEDELAYIQRLQRKYNHVSAELAISGKHGIESLVDHFLEKHPSQGLEAAVKRAQSAGRPVGAVLLEIAEKGEGQDQVVAQKILHNLGNMIGSIIRDHIVTFKASGGVYLIGSVSLGLGEYLAASTNFLKRITPGATHDPWIGQVPIYLVTDPNVAVKGALALAEQTLHLGV